MKKKKECANLIEEILLEEEVLELERVKALELEILRLRKRILELETDHARYWAWRERDVSGDFGIFR